MEQGVDSLGWREGMLLILSCSREYLDCGQVSMAPLAANARSEGPLKP